MLIRRGQAREGELGDYRRAQEWTEAIEDCIIRTGLSSFPGDCETHRIQIMIRSGAWAVAEQMAPPSLCQHAILRPWPCGACLRQHR